MCKSNLYDLDLVHEQCVEVGLKSEFASSDLLVIHLIDDVTLRFENNVTTIQADGAAIHDDSLIDLGDDGGWHTHVHEFEFADPRGYYVSMHYLDVIAGIASGEVLIGELRNKGELVERMLLHRDYNNEFKYMDEGDEIIIRRVLPSQ